MAIDSSALYKSRLQPFFTDKPEIAFAYLFGSVAKGNAGRLSDIDIAIFLDPMRLVRDSGYGYQSELSVELQSILSGQVDLVILNDASTILRFQVLKNGVLIYCRSEKQRRVFHEDAVGKYLDFKPFLKTQSRYLYKRLAEGSFGGGCCG